MENLIRLPIIRVCLLREHLHLSQFPPPPPPPPSSKIRSGLKLTIEKTKWGKGGRRTLSRIDYQSWWSQNYLCDWPFWWACKLWKTIRRIVIRLYDFFKVAVSWGFCCFRSILCLTHYFEALILQNASVKLWQRYQMNFIRKG